MTDILSIIHQMTLEEKAALCTGASAWTTTPIERLGVPEMIVSDGPHGVRRVEDVKALSSQPLPSTCFPTASCLASTWDVDLVHEMGQALGEECIALNVDVLLGPGANMKRTPLCGRNFEYFSEDPYLAGELAASLIQGVQSKGVGTSLKHFALNNQEYRRFSINAAVDERALREIYLPAFETAVKKGKPWTVMCAYNKANGTYCSQNHRLLEEILRQEWGFEGLVVSDWGAVRDRVAALSAGLELEMPGPKDRRVKEVIEAVRTGEPRRGRFRRSGPPDFGRRLQGCRNTQRWSIRYRRPPCPGAQNGRRRHGSAEEQRRPAAAKSAAHRGDRSRRQGTLFPGRGQLSQQPDQTGHSPG